MHTNVCQLFHEFHSAPILTPDLTFIPSDTDALLSEYMSTLTTEPETFSLALGINDILHYYQNKCQPLQQNLKPFP